MFFPVDKKLFTLFRSRTTNKDKQFKGFPRQFIQLVFANPDWARVQLVFAEHLQTLQPGFTTGSTQAANSSAGRLSGQLLFNSR